MNVKYRFEFLYNGTHKYVDYIYASSFKHAINIARKILRDKFKNKRGYTAEIYEDFLNTKYIVKPIAALKR